MFIALCVIGGFSINAYRETYSFQGSGVYDNTNTFTLDSNALILFAFILVMGFVLSFGYFGLAAMFPKVKPNSRPTLISAIHLDYRYSPLYLRVRVSYRILLLPLLLCGHCISHLCHLLRHLLPLLASPNPILRPDFPIYDEDHGKVSVNFDGQCPRIDLYSRLWSLLDAHFGRGVR